MSADPGFSETAALVRGHDRERYLAALFAPKLFRADLMALYAFNCELARIPDLVSEPMLGEIRLQWWRDVLDGPGREAPTGNPLADALADAITRHSLPVAQLKGMIDARSAYLDGGGFNDFQALKAYLYKSEGAVFALSAKILGKEDASVTRAANAAGVAYGLKKVLANLPRDAAAGRVMLPLDLLERHGIQPEQVLAGNEAASLADVVAELVGEGREALAAFRQTFGGLKGSANPAFAPLATFDAIISKVEAAGHRPLHDIAEINPLVRFIHIWRAARTGRI